MRVSIPPGQIEFTRMPSFEYSNAAFLVRPLIACFDAAYGPSPGNPISPAAEARFTIAPPPFFTIQSISYLRQRKVPLAFTDMTLSKSSSACSARGTILPSMPALLHAQSSRPKAATALAIKALTFAASVTSARTKIASPAFSLMRATVSLPPSSFKSETTTLAPSSANLSAAARPIPAPAPVTRATFPDTRPIGSLAALIFKTHIVVQDLALQRYEHDCQNAHDASRAQPSRNGLAGLASPQATTDIAGRLFCGNRRLHCLFDSGRGSLECIGLPASAMPGEKHPNRQNQGQRIRYILARDIGRRAMRRLRHTVIGPRIERGSKAQAARQFSGQVGKNIAIHIGSDDDVETLRIAHDVCHHRVDNYVVDRDCRKFLRHLVARLDEKTIGHFQHVGLVHNGNSLAPAHR